MGIVLRESSSDDSPLWNAPQKEKAPHVIRRRCLLFCFHLHQKEERERERERRAIAYKAAPASPRPPVDNYLPIYRTAFATTARLQLPVQP